MQSPNGMSGLSPAEDVERRFKYSGYDLRNGQRRFIQYVSDHPDQNVYNGVFPTGYGKSAIAEAVSDVLKQQGRATRFIFVVPTDTQRTQYAEGIARDVSRFNLNLRLMRHESEEGIAYSTPVVLSHTVADLRAHLENRCEVFITTIQSIHANQGWYADLMANGMWCVFADEYQKLNREDSAKWGKALESLNYNVLFGLTATPVRTDRKQTVFASKKPDVIVTFEEAFAEQAIRQVIAHIEHYFVDVINDENEVERLTTENIEDYDISKDLRYTTKYYASILGSAHDCLASKELSQPGQHQMLVFAMSVRHARSVSDALNVLFGKGFSEWVGVGPDGKSTKENKDVLARYKKNEIPCLVQVDIAGEGFDNPRSSVLVFLNLLRRASVRAVQQVGRGLRRNYDIGLFSDDTCDMFASPDTEMADLIKEMAQQTLSLDTECDAEQGEDETREQKGPRMYDIPPYESTVKNAEHDRSEIVSRIPQQDVDTFRNAVEKREPSAAASVTDERLREILADERIEQLKKVDAMNSDPKALRDKVAKAQSLLVGNAMRVRYGSSAPSSAAGDFHKKINSRWKRSSGVGHSEMLDDDFKRKYNWLSDINSTIKETGDLPQWLQL